MDKTEAALGNFLREKAEESWSNKAPYLLSFLAPDLKPSGLAYKDVIGEETLKQFAARTGETYGYKLVQHPLKKAKVGVIPADAEFKFDEALTNPSPFTRDGRRDGILVDFLRALGKLPPADIDKVIIPASVLVKLARHR